MSDFNPKTPLMMATFKTVHGFGLGRGTSLKIVEEPARAGEVTEAMARRLFASSIAVPEDNFRPTPVETPEQEAARIAAARADEDGDGLPDDLDVTVKALRQIAKDEEIEVLSGDDKATLQTKIIEGRAAKVEGADAEAAPDVEVIS